MASQLSEKLTRYLESLEPSHHPVLAEMEELARQEKFPIVGPQCGRVLATLATAVGARRVFEMGSGFGYSTFWFACAVGPEGEVVHTDGDPGNSEKAQQFLGAAALVDRCKFLVGDAIQLLGQEEGEFDCIFIDIDKDGYPLALRGANQKLRYGGILIAHNALWGGRVAEDDSDAATTGIRQYNWEAENHPELLTFINPVHDGLAISLKVPSKNRLQIPV